MKEKGFTLIELLAVIVILAIIALIATPIVLNIIKDSKNSSVERSAELYLDQVKNEIARYNMTHPSSNFNPSECTVQSDDSLICDGTSLNIEISGDKPSAGSKILLSNGSITGLQDFKISGKLLKYNNGKITQSSGTEKICKGVTTKTTGNVPHGKYVAGDEYICDVGDGENKTFFVLENNTDTVSLIMYANIDVDGKAVTSSSSKELSVAWASLEDYISAGGTESEYYAHGNDKGPLTVNKKLHEVTSTWTNLSSSQITLPTIEQLSNVTGGLSVRWGTQYNLNNSVEWLYDYMSDKSIHKTNAWSYYTSSTSDYVASNGSSVEVWYFISYYNALFGDAVWRDYYGVRPVITISKSMIN